MSRKPARPKAVEGKLPAPPLSPKEQELLATTTAKVRSFPRRPVFVIENKVLRVGPVGKEGLDGALLQEAFAASSGEVVDHLIRQLMAVVGSTGNESLDADAFSAAVALVASVEPRNELEVALAIQMVAANNAALLCFRRMRSAEYVEHMSGYSNMANKAARTLVMQVEALNKLRRGGEQVVRHVHVNEGGQAVIAGTVNTGGGS